MRYIVKCEKKTIIDIENDEITNKELINISDKKTKNSRKRQIRRKVEN